MMMNPFVSSTKALVRSLGYAARAFASAEEFLNSNPDDTSCLILDVQMEGLSGVELQERLIAEGRRTPIIFITAFADDGTRSHVLDSGAIGFLRKPFSDDKLIALYRFRSRAIRVLNRINYPLPANTHRKTFGRWPKRAR